VHAAVVPISRCGALCSRMLISSLIFLITACVFMSGLSPACSFPCDPASGLPLQSHCMCLLAVERQAGVLDCALIGVGLSCHVAIACGLVLTAHTCCQP
jgi:hypothetical protein